MKICVGASVKVIVVLLCVAVVVGCARDQAESVLSGSHRTAVTSVPAIPEPPSDAIPTAAGQTDFKPNTAFREYAAKTLKVTPAEIEGGAIDAQVAKTMPNSIGNAWAFTMWLKSDRAREVRGWATPKGTVITLEQNLGLLFVEAGVWGKKPRRDRDLADKLAELVVWVYGMNHLVESETDVLPSFEFDARGNGRLRFISSYRVPGPGGAGGGPKTYTDNVIALTRDRKATLTKTPHHR